MNWVWWSKSMILGNYQLHHDYVFDDDGNLLIHGNGYRETDGRGLCIKTQSFHR